MQVKILFFGSIVFFLASLGICRSAYPLPLYAPPSKIIGLSSVEYVQGDGRSWFCSVVRFKNSWDFAPSHWGGWIEIPNSLKIVSVSQVDNVKISGKIARFTNDYWNTEVEPNEEVEAYVCGEYSPLIKYNDLQWKGSLLFTLDIKTPPAPIDFGSGFPVAAKENKDSCYPKLGTAKNWNLFVRDDLDLNMAKIGGKAAIGGLTMIRELWEELGTNICPSSCKSSDVFFYGAGNVQWESGRGTCGGWAIKSASLPLSSKLYENPASCPRKFDSSLIDMESEFSTLETAASEISTYQPSATVGYSSPSGGYLRLYLHKETGKRAVFFIPGDLVSLGGISKLSIYNKEYLSVAETIIFNIDGKSLDFKHFNWKELETYGSKVIFNFYEAESIIFDGAKLRGLILAPYAAVKMLTGSTLIDGSLWARSLTGKDVYFETNFNWDGFGLEELCSVCKDNHYGRKCIACSCNQVNQICDDGPFGSGSCQCRPNWNSACNDCASGFYGPLCNASCSESCKQRGVCDDGISGDGSCDCRNPWGGSQCEDCAYGFWGQNCENRCSQTCLDRGTCLGGINGSGLCNCSLPWGGDQCEVCDKGFYGSNCQFACSKTCARNGECSNGFNGNGACLSCKPNFSGSECEFCASDELYGPDCLECSGTCLKFGVCDSGINGTGECSNCSQGISGSQCEKCAVMNRYGSSCSSICTTTCLRNGYCDNGPMGTGSCSCKVRYTGLQCENAGFSSTTISLIHFLLMFAMHFLML